MNTGQFEHYHFLRPDPAAAWLAANDPEAVYLNGERAGVKKTAASLMWDFLRGELPQGEFAPAQNIDGDEINHEAWVEARRAKETTVYDLERPGRMGKHRRIAPAQMLTIDQWNAVRVLTPRTYKNWDVLVGLARGMSTADIGKMIGRTPRQVRNIINQLLKYACGLGAGLAASHLDDPITTEVAIRRAPSRAGRKPRTKVKTEITTATIYDLFGDPVQSQKPRKLRKIGVRARTPRAVAQGQVDLFGKAA